MPEPFEIHAELDDGWRITRDGQTEAWQGVRVRYRPLGSRGRYRHFLLEYDEQPTIVQLQRVCADHEAHRG